MRDELRRILFVSGACRWGSVQQFVDGVDEDLGVRAVDVVVAAEFDQVGVLHEGDGLPGLGIGGGGHEDSVGGVGVFGVDEYGGDGDLAYQGGVVDAVVPGEVVEVIAETQVIFREVQEGEVERGRQEEDLQGLIGMFVDVLLGVIGDAGHGLGHVQASPQAVAQVEGRPAFGWSGVEVFVHGLIGIEVGEGPLEVTFFGGEDGRVFEDGADDVLSAVGGHVGGQEPSRGVAGDDGGFFDDVVDHPDEGVAVGIEIVEGRVVGG